MKKITSLIMIAVFMTVFTSTANTTAKMEQKQKTEFVKECTFQINAVSVVNECPVVSVNAEATNFTVDAYQSLTSESFPVILNAIAADVGWSGNKRVVNSRFSQMQPLTYKRIPIVCLRDKSNKIRNDC